MGTHNTFLWRNTKKMSGFFRLKKKNNIKMPYPVVSMLLHRLTLAFTESIYVKLLLYNVTQIT